MHWAQIPSDTRTQHPGTKAYDIIRRVITTQQLGGIHYTLTQREYIIPQADTRH